MDTHSTKMMYIDLPYYEDIRAKTCRKYKMKTSTKITQTLYMQLENGP